MRKHHLRQTLDLMMQMKKYCALCFSLSRLFFLFFWSFYIHVVNDMFFFILTYFCCCGGWWKTKARRPGKQLSDYDRWEAMQLVKSGVVGIEFDPDFDETVGMTHVDEEIETFEIELNDSEPLFLRGQTGKSGVMISPPKVVKNPDGSLARAAVAQSALSKERRELRYFCPF